MELRTWLTDNYCYFDRGGGGGGEGVALKCQEGVSGSTKNSRKRVFFHNQALYMCNMNRVSNSCKIGLKGMIFLRYYVHLGLFFMQKLCKWVFF